MCTERSFEKRSPGSAISGIAAALLAAVLILSAAAPVFAASEEKSLNYLFKDIYVDGRHINNYQLSDPVCIVAGSAYIPLNAEFLSLLGLEKLAGGGVIQFRKTEAVPYSAPADLCFNVNHFDDRRGVPIYEGAEFFLVEEFAEPTYFSAKNRQARQMLHYGQQLAGLYQNRGASEAGNISAEEARSVEPLSEELPLKKLALSSADFFDCGGVLYVRLTALTSLPELPYSAYFDSIGGLSISTDASVSAQYLFSNNNRSYIEGRAAYMRNAQPALTENDSLILEYLFRHEATVHGISQDLLMAVSRTESTYDLSLLERRSPIGLMQLMPRTVEGKGWTIEDVRDKHGNIQFGAEYISYLIDLYRGNETKALSAYNQGTGTVKSGNYSTAYAAKVQTFMSNIAVWCANRGYAPRFLRVSERLQ
jgi:hypothetical protein